MKEIALKKAFKENEEAIGIASDLVGDEPMTAGELEACFKRNQSKSATIRKLMDRRNRLLVQKFTLFKE